MRIYVFQAGRDSGPFGHTSLPDGANLPPAGGAWAWTGASYELPAASGGVARFEPDGPHAQLRRQGYFVHPD